MGNEGILHICPLGIFYNHLLYVVVIWCIFPILACCKKNIETFLGMEIYPKFEKK
jgi:hypothetical protein